MKNSLPRPVRVLVAAAALLAVLPLACHAADTRVVCTSRDGDMTKTVDFDETAQSATMNGQRMAAVSITRQKIRFVHDLGVAGAWPVEIDRTTGIMLITMAGKPPPGAPTHLPPLDCRPAVQRF